MCVRVCVCVRAHIYICIDFPAIWKHSVLWNLSNLKWHKSKKQLPLIYMGKFWGKKTLTSKCYTQTHNSCSSVPNYILFTILKKKCLHLSPGRWSRTKSSRMETLCCKRHGSEYQKHLGIEFRINLWHLGKSSIPIQTQL